jgi:type I restriction enzyme S subunit
MNALRGSGAVLNQMGANIRGQTRPGINGDIVRKLFVPLAPRAEQIEIVERIELALEGLKRATEEQGKVETLLDHLRQGLLAKAFYGQLVPQDPQDEPVQKAVRASP